MGQDKDDEVEDDSFTLKLVSCRNALLATITLNNFLIQHEMTTQDLLNIL